MRARNSIIAVAALALSLGGAWLALPALASEHAISGSDAKADGGKKSAEEVRAEHRKELVPSGGLSKAAPTQTLTISGKPVFVPPNRGTPVARVGGAARSIERLPGIEALVPLESGLTLNEQPILYWYVSEATDLPVNFTLIDLNLENPLLDLTFAGPFDRGVHAIRLDDYPVQLSQGKLYQWFIALVPDPDDRSSDRLAGGGIELVDTKAWLRKRLDTAAPEQIPAILAGAGVWYDALAVLSERIESAPDDPQPREQRSELFRQVGLEAVLATN
jgi:hypothetical protein